MGSANSGRRSTETLDEAYLSGCVYTLTRIEQACRNERKRLQSQKQDTEKAA